MVEKQNDKNIKILILYCGGEFISNQFLSIVNKME
jgi:hypothetical protein